MNPHTFAALKKGAARCPRFDGCNAPICPLDPHWQRSQHLDGESVCSLLCELVKSGGEARLRGYVPSEVVQTLIEVLPLVSSRWGRVRSALKRAAGCGSRRESGMRLNAMKSRDAASSGDAPLAEVSPTRPTLPALPLNESGEAVQ